MFLAELNELFRENWSKFLTAEYLVFVNTSLLLGIQTLRIIYLCDLIMHDIWSFVSLAMSYTKLIRFEPEICLVDSFFYPTKARNKAVLVTKRPWSEMTVNSKNIQPCVYGRIFVYTFCLINTCSSLSDDANEIKTLNIERA